MKKIYFFSLITCFGLFPAVAQESFYFKTALAASIPQRYGREAIYTDMLAYQLYSNTLKRPEANAVWGKDDRGENIVWQPVLADSANRLLNPNRRGGFGFGRGGYLYLTYVSKKETVALLNVRGPGSYFFNGILHAADTYNMGWMNVPVKLKRGLNELYLRGTFAVASLSFPTKQVLLHSGDHTLPSIVPGNDNKDLMGAIVVINTSDRELKDLKIRSIIAGNTITTGVPGIPPMSTRKIIFHFNAATITATGKQECQLSLLKGNQELDKTVLQIEAVNPSDKYSITFKSKIDGSLQYYAVAPQSGAGKANSALFLSVHGAGVEAIGQARAYRSKDWGNLVAPTNRRPRGFNWEDWGRIDALEVLELAKERFKPDPGSIYLTGHSMGGHGTWFLGATYPDKWAAIAPCAGYPTLKGYGSADGLVPDSSNDPMERVLLKASNQSDMIKLASNYKPFGVYIFHGDADRTVSVEYARQMRGILGQFHTDLSYYEYPGGSHWFGDHSVDWDPLFDFFKWHKRKVDSSVHEIDFMTANPGISSSFRWAAIYQQQEPLQYSRIRLTRSSHSITGSTGNVRVLQLDLSYFGSNNPVKIIMDSMNTLQYTTTRKDDTIYLLKKDAQWTLHSKPSSNEKGPHRYGTLKDAFNHQMVFVYGTVGNKEENEWALNKARYDAESWYYRGNGAVDIVADKDFAVANYKDRGIILYGNSTTNKAWELLLGDCPIQVGRNKISMGTKTWEGADYGACFVWPIAGSSIASVAVIGGTGLKGMHAADANQYFAGASGFPDYMIFSLDMLKDGAGQVKAAGFFDHVWKLRQ